MLACAYLGQAIYSTAYLTLVRWHSSWALPDYHLMLFTFPILPLAKNFGSQKPKFFCLENKIRFLKTEFFLNLQGQILKFNLIPLTWLFRFLREYIINGVDLVDFFWYIDLVDFIIPLYCLNESICIVNSDARIIESSRKINVLLNEYHIETRNDICLKIYLS